MIDDILLQTKDKLIYLGVTINNKLNWEDHINKVFNKCLGLLYLLRQMKDICSQKKLIQIYTNVIRNVVEYACTAFVGAPKVYLKKLSYIQRRAHNIICNFNCHCNLLEKLDSRRIDLAVKLFKKICQDPENILYDICPQKMVNSNQFRLPFLRYSSSMQQFFPYISKWINSQNNRICYS